MKKEKSSLKREVKWVKAAGKLVPEEQLKKARRELNELMDDHDTQYQRMRKDVMNPEKQFDVHTLLYWLHIFNSDGECKLAGVASERVEALLEHSLQMDPSWRNSADVAMVYGKNLGMEERVVELMDDLAGASVDFEKSLALAELHTEALGDRMMGGECYRQAEGLITNLTERCQMAESVTMYFDKEWGEDICRRYVEDELEYPSFDVLFPIIDILENIDVDLADKAKEKVVELAGCDKEKLKALMNTDFAEIYLPIPQDVQP